MFVLLLHMHSGNLSLINSSPCMQQQRPRLFGYLCLIIITALDLCPTVDSLRSVSVFGRVCLPTPTLSHCCSTSEETPSVVWHGLIAPLLPNQHWVICNQIVHAFPFFRLQSTSSPQTSFTGEPPVRYGHFGVPEAARRSCSASTLNSSRKAPAHRSSAPASCSGRDVNSHAAHSRKL